MPTKIEYVDETQNFWSGCNEVSDGCDNCYAKRIVEARPGLSFHHVRRATNDYFLRPLSWAKPRLILTCSMSDFFHRRADEWRGDAWQVIRNRPEHRWLILTKRIERVADHLPEDWGEGYDNVWLGTSIENQAMADKRLPILIGLPAKHRWISAEPLLEEINIKRYLLEGWHKLIPKITWVIAGGESGPGCRPMKAEWAESIRIQCDIAGTIFFFKQMGGEVKTDLHWGGNLLNGVQYLDRPSFWPEKPQSAQMELFSLPEKQTKIPRGLQ